MGQVHSEGLQWIGDVCLSETQSVPANFYVGLAVNATLAKDATLASITEVSGSGYARQAIPSSGAGWTDAEAGTDDRKYTGAEVTFNATGDWTTGSMWFLATTSDNSGKLIASAKLTDDAGAEETVTLHNGESRDQVVEVRFNG